MNGFGLWALGGFEACGCALGFGGSGSGLDLGLDLEGEPGGSI